MAKVSIIERNKKRKNMTQALYKKRSKLKGIIYDKTVSLEERFSAVLALAQLPRNSARIRVRNRCELTGRPRGYYRKFALSRSMIRNFAGHGLIPGLVKASW